MQIFQIPVLQDNYIYLLYDQVTHSVAAIDPALAQPVETFLEKKNWKLNYILNTHHHPDHVGANLDLKKKYQCQIVGFAEDATRIPGIDVHLQDRGTWIFGSQLIKVLFLPGHTLGHIAYFFVQEDVLFCGDTLFAMGCGRLFEGTSKQMFDSLQKIKKLPLKTKIYCAHEYTEKNANFALIEDPHNADLKRRAQKVRERRKNNLPTIPFLLSEELQTNPFLRAKTVSAFARLREKRDQF